MKANKSKTPPINKNDDITVSVDALGSQGQGVGRLNGYAVFIAGALPGETVRAHIIKATPTYAVAKLLAVETASKHRIEAPCPQFSRCGGCTLLHYRYGQQLSYKQDLVENALKRIGGFDSPNVLPVIGMEEPWRYRNKGSFPFALVNGRVEMGFYAPRSHRLAPVADCAIQQESIVRAAAAVRDWAQANAVAPYNEETAKGVLRHVVARVSTKNELMVVVVTTGALPKKQTLVESICAAAPETVSIQHNINCQPDNTILGDEFRLLYGSARIQESICNNIFEVSAASFLQVNPVQTEQLYQTALSYCALTGNEFVMDAYCGIGSISLLLARHAKKVLGIELFHQAVEDAQNNAKANGINNADFLCAPAEEALPRLVEQGMRPDVIVADPPRKGCELPFLEAVVKSGVKRMVYISCDPGTLARDCGVLRENGFSLIQVQPVDMFPQTAGVENVALLEKNLEDIS